MYKKFVKRAMDLFLSFVILLLLWPLMLIVALAVRLESKGPAVFKQTRLGKNGKEFTLYKFRSMVQNAEHTGSGVYSEKGDARVTKVGRFIR
ncbi:MAG: sugar transferase, partial [Clostridia bacterium]|nr:sugar transferase [Clostridia bacterium]